MSGRILTASSLERYAICPASAVLPRADSLVGQAAQRGTAIHGFLEGVPVVGRDEALAGVADEYRAACEAIDLGALPLDATKFAAEVAFAFDVATGRAREVGRSIGRNYGEVAGTEILGTADVVGLSADGGEALILDYKTGRSKLTEAARNWQLRFLALAACRVYGASSARVALVHVHENGLASYDAATLDPFEIDLIGIEMRDLHRRVARAAADWDAGRPPHATTGHHCTHCPSLVYCPAQTALMRVVEGELEDEHARSWRPITVEDAARELVRVRAAEAHIKRRKAALVTFAKAHPIPLPGGLVYGLFETTEEEVDGATARAALLDFEKGAEAAAYLSAWVTSTDPAPALADLSGWAIAERSCDFTSSKAAVGRAVRPAATALGIKFAAANRTALDALRTAGAIVRTTTAKMKEGIPNRLAAAEAAELLTSPDGPSAQETHA